MTNKYNEFQSEMFNIIKEISNAKDTEIKDFSYNDFIQDKIIRTQTLMKEYDLVNQCPIIDNQLKLVLKQIENNENNVPLFNSGLFGLITVLPQLMKVSQLIDIDIVFSLSTTNLIIKRNDINTHYLISFLDNNSFNFFMISSFLNKETNQWEILSDTEVIIPEITLLSAFNIIFETILEEQDPNDDSDDN